MSNEIFDAAIAAELVTLTREVDAPIGPLGYGEDLVCINDVTPDFAETDPESPAGIVQQTIRMWTMPRGALLDAPDRGIDLRAYCNRGVTTAELQSLGLALANEARKDDRIDDISVTVTVLYVPPPVRLTVQATITPVARALRDFTFTFAVTDAGVLIETLDITGT